MDRRAFLQGLAALAIAPALPIPVPVPVAVAPGLDWEMAFKGWQGKQFGQTFFFVSASTMRQLESTCKGGLENFVETQRIAVPKGYDYE